MAMYHFKADRHKAGGFRMVIVTAHGRTASSVIMCCSGIFVNCSVQDCGSAATNIRLDHGLKIVDALIKQRSWRAFSSDVRTAGIMIARGLPHDAHNNCRKDIMPYMEHVNSAQEPVLPLGCEPLTKEIQAESNRSR
jgi:hypothetical protein